MSEGVFHPDPESLLAHSTWIRGIVRALVFDENQVDDVVQATWLAALQRPRRLWLHPRAWLGSVARNLARETNRKEARLAQREECAARPEALPSTQELVETAELQRHVAQAVLELDEPYRSTLLLRYFAELSAEEIARRQDLPASTVRNRIRHALERLRERFDREHLGDRRAWALGMLALVRQGSSTGADATASLAAQAPSSSSFGGSLMLSKICMGVAAALSVAGGTTAVLLRNKALQREEVTSVSARALAEPDADVASAPPAAIAALDQQRTAVAVAERAHVLSGVMRDSGGLPIKAAEVFIGGWRNPFGTAEGEVALELRGGRVIRTGLDKIRALDLESMLREDLMCGCIVATDERGGFEVHLPNATRAWIQPARAAGVQPLEGSGMWYSPPARDIALRAERIPIASLNVRVLDETTSQLLTSFDGRIREQRRAEGRAGEPFVAEFCARRSETANLILEIEGGPEEYVVQLHEPSWAPASEVVLVSAGADAQVELTVRSGAGLSGVVTDESGTAVEGALVFWGDQMRMRGHSSPTGAFHAKCAPEPAVTDARGCFKLPGSAELVTAWHPELSPTTVPASAASQLRLGARGGLRGRLVDEQGQPLAGERVVLDRDRATTTDASGTWSFEHLEAELHGVELPRGRSFVARVPSGDVLTIDPDWIGGVTVDILSGGAPYREQFGGVLVGSGQTFLIREFKTEQGQLGVWNAIPGSYYLVSDSGRIARFDVAATTSTVELGDADLTVRASPEERVYLLPEEADEALAFWSRIWAIEISETGTATWKPLARGRWQVATHTRGVVATVQVNGPGSEISIE